MIANGNNLCCMCGKSRWAVCKAIKIDRAAFRGVVMQMRLIQSGVMLNKVIQKEK